MNLISRRTLARIAGGLAAGRAPLHGAGGGSAQEAIRQILERLGGEPRETGLDGFKAGNPETEVRGIATTAIATLDVLHQASKAGLNLILTHEPTFFGIGDGAPPPPQAAVGRGRRPAGVTADDPVYKAKKEFIEKNNLAVFRLRDHWLAARQNEMITGLADSLGWAGYGVRGETMMYDIPSATLQETVVLIRKRLNLRGGLRAVGNPKAKVRRVMLHPGLMSVAVMWKHFDKVDLLIAGEVREWECVHYAADMNTAGESRSLVTIGRVAAEEPGMRACGAWLKTTIKEIPIQWIGAGDPYWRAV